MKKLLSLVLAIVLLAGMAVPASAANESPERDDSALTFAEARQKGIPYDKPIDQKTREEMLREGLRFYGGTVPLSPNGVGPRATTSDVLGYITATGNTYVYLNKDSGTQVGFVSYRAIVYVYAISGNYAYIQFKNENGVLTRGYITNTAVYTPASGWATPITKGKVTQYYGDTATDPNGHTGTDVGGHGGSHPEVYAVFNGTAKFQETTKHCADGTILFANYGKHVRLSSGNYTVIYGHLDSFDGVSSHDYASEGYPRVEKAKGIPVDPTDTIATTAVVKGDTLGRVGTTGLSSGIHLHFEVRVNGTITDPFTYVVFPKGS